MSKQKGKHCLILTGGTVGISFLIKITEEKEFPYIFAVDRGLEAAHEAGIVPTHLVGDFDSVSQKLLAQYAGIPGCEEHNGVLRHPQNGGVGLFIERLIPEKDDTDTEHAMRMAVELAPDEIWVIGGFGSRFDHTLANIHTLLIPHRAGIPAYMLDETNRVRLISGQFPGTVELKRNEQYGRYVSFLPLTEKVTGVNLSGFKYPVTNAAFSVTSSFGMGVSNEILEETARISVTDGVLVMVEAKDCP